jgi:hypothetical protein
MHQSEDLFIHQISTMKKIFPGLLLLLATHVTAQDTTLVEQYCRLEATGRLLSNRVTIDVDFGEARRVLTDYRLRDEETGKLKKFNSVIDALNYMGSQGWTLVNAFPVYGTSSTVSNPSTYHYYFKKSFPRSSTQ